MNNKDSNSNEYRRAKLEFKNFIKKSKNNMKLRKKPINNSLIFYFYESPQKFFTQYQKSLKYSSYFDICGNSIFIHYFYFLYEEHKYSKKNITKNEKNDKVLSNINIYQTNFDQFFVEHKDKLLIKDIYNETCLHKIGKFHDPTFFVTIFQKLNQLGVLNDNLLLIKNINNETCCDYIFEEIKNIYEYYININDHDYNLLKNFILTIKNNYYSSIFEPLSFDTKIILNHFILKIDFDINKKPKFEHNGKDLDLYLFEYIFKSYFNGINYLNILFDLCKSKEDFNKLLNLVNQIQMTKEISIINNLNILSISELCILNHMCYAFRKMNFSKSKRQN